MTRAELAGTLRALADGLASVDTCDPEAPSVLTRIADRLSELAAHEHEPEIVTTMRTVAAQCAEVAEAIKALESTGDANRSAAAGTLAIGRTARPAAALAKTAVPTRTDMGRCGVSLGYLKRIQ